jgi:single-strand DNA-binding protein
MASYHSTLIIGNVGKDPETRHIGDGKQVCSFSVAVTDKWKTADGGLQEKTTWYKVSAWSRLADVCQQYVKKGMSVMVQGTSSTSAWIDKDGEPRASLELTARDVQFLGKCDNSQQSDGGNYTPPDDKDIPFDYS